MSQQSIFEFISAQGLGWFFAIVLLIPLSFLLILIVSKRYLGIDFDKFMQNQRDEIESELKIVTKLEDLCEKISSMADAMWGNRDYTDRKVKEVKDHFDGQNRDIIARLERIQHDTTVILSVAKKRNTDWIREPNTEVLRQERK